MTLSFIIPVYNVVPYLRKCVDSLLAQDYDDYEIILVDDGSTDDSWQIIQEYVSRFRGLEDERIRGIHQENGGLSAARNTGIKAAKGEYICFVDSDDYWEPNVLGRLMEQIEKENLDVLRFDYQNVNDRYKIFNPNKTPRYIDRKNEIVDGEMYLNTRMGYACYAVMFILRRDIILNLKSEIINHKSEIDDCLFTPGLHFEDVDWLPRMMLAAKRVNSTPTIVYNYFVRQGSITQTQGNKNKIRKNLDDRMTIIEQYASYRAQYPACMWLRNMQSSMVVGVLTTVARDFYDERKEYIRRLRELQVFPLSLADQGKTYIRRARLISLFGTNIYCTLIRLRG